MAHCVQSACHLRTAHPRPRVFQRPAAVPPRSATSPRPDQMAQQGTDSVVVHELKRICVFCGSARGARDEYEAAAVALGEQLVKEKLGLVYGGGTVGLMGIIAKTVLKGLGDSGVIGVIPEALAPRELSGEMIGQLQTVPDMHTRKALMAKQSDGFIAMPGGFGTLEELMEVITWQQLGFHCKPIGLLNTAGFYDPLVAFFRHCVAEGFIQAEYCTVLVSADPAELVQMMRDFKAPISIIDRHWGAITAKGPDGIDVSTSSQP